MNRASAAIEDLSGICSLDQEIDTKKNTRTNQSFK